MAIYINFEKGGGDKLHDALVGSPAYYTGEIALVKDGNKDVLCVGENNEDNITINVKRAKFTNPLMKEYKNEPLNIGPVIYYYLLKQAEAQNIRILYSLEVLSRFATCAILDEYAIFSFNSLICCSVSCCVCSFLLYLFIKDLNQLSSLFVIVNKILISCSQNYIFLFNHLLFCNFALKDKQ